MSSEAPIAFGPYSLLKKLGQGGMAVTFKAREAMEGIGGSRLVAIKQILPLFANDPSFRRMFLDEARLSTQLNHQNVCRSYTAGEIDGTLFLAMEFIDGADLYHLMCRAAALPGAFPLPHALAVCQRVLHGLQAAHELRGDNGDLLNLVHRDVSPQNILLSRQGEVKVIDFGVAKARSNQAQTQAGMVKGKVLYFSPEQLNGQPLDRRSDLFAVGLLLYELVTGEHPLRGDTDIETIFNYVSRTIRPPREVRPDLPPAVDAIIMKALQKDPQDRFPDADAMARALGDALFEVYPAYQDYLLRDFVAWALAEDGDAPYALPERRTPSSPQAHHLPAPAPASTPAPTPAPPPRPSDPGFWPITPSQEPALTPSNPAFAPPPPAHSGPYPAPQPWGPQPTGPHTPQPTYPPPQPQEEPSNTGWYVAIGVLGFIALGCLIALFATVLGGS